MITHVKRSLLGVAMTAALLTAGLVGFAFVPTLTGYESHIVTSGSMGDAAPVGSVVLTRMVSAASIGVGDIVVYRRPTAASTVTHRVIDRSVTGSTYTFRTKGDANLAADPEPLTIVARVARVERVVPYAGRVVMFARSPLGALTLLLLPTIGLLFGARPRGKAAPLPAGAVTTAWRYTTNPPDDVAVTGLWPAVQHQTEHRNAS